MGDIRIGVIITSRVTFTFNGGTVSEDIRKFIDISQQRDGEVWYIASPYSHQDPEIEKQRVEDVTKAVLHISNRYPNVFPFSPVLYTVNLQRAGLEFPPAGWYQFDLWMLNNCQRLWVLELEGWQASMGIALEIAYAQAKHIPIYTNTLAELLKGEDIPF